MFIPYGKNFSLVPISRSSVNVKVKIQGHILEKSDRYRNITITLDQDTCIHIVYKNNASSQLLLYASYFYLHCTYAFRDTFIIIIIIITIIFHQPFQILRKSEFHMRHNVK